MSISSQPATGAGARATANQEAVDRLRTADPVLVDVRPAGEVVPGMTPRTILTSGAPLAWDAYTGGQRRAVLAGAVYEGLASDPEDAAARIEAGDITLGTCHAHGCVGSVAGIYTASMPVFVVRNEVHGNTGFCNLYEGESRRRLNYGVYDDEVARGLRLLEEVVAPVLAQAVRRAGGIRLKPLMARALRMGDELHSRNTAATTLLLNELTPHLVELALGREVEADALRQTLAFVRQSDYFFLRLSMASSKAAADAAQGVHGSSIVTAMTISCQDFSIRVSGLGDRWFRGPHPVVEAKLFEPYTMDDNEWVGGESCITETVGLGGFAQACAFALQAYQGGSPQEMVRMNEAMYDIAAGEHADYHIPFLGHRGTPVGIDVFRVLETGVAPVIDGGLAGKDGVGQIGAGILKAPMECFQARRRRVRRAGRRGRGRVMRRFSRAHTTLVFDPHAEPLAELRDGERVVVETADSLCGLAKARAPGGLHIEEVVDTLGGACPLTGPFFVTGARAGEALEVDIHRVAAVPESGTGWTGVFGGFGALDAERYSLTRPAVEPEITLVPYADGVARFPCRGHHVEIPMRPFVGTLGVAPRLERRMTFSQSPDYLGDVDVPDLTAGATVVLPVNVDGALLGLGDVHGAQGGGEITGAALEIEADVELTVRARGREEARLMRLPQINTAEAIGSVAGFEGVPLADCARAAYADLIARLERHHGYRRSEAYQLLSQVGRLVVGNMIDPFYSVMAAIDRRYL